MAIEFLYNAITIDSVKILVEIMQNLIKKDNMKVLANDGISANAVDILNKNGFDVYLDRIEQNNLIDFINLKEYLYFLYEVLLRLERILLMTVVH